MTKAKNYDLNMEQAVIGTLLMGMEDAKHTCTIMNPNWFYGNKNKKIYDILKSKIDENIAPDMTLVIRWLTDKGILADIGGSVYLADCMESISTSAHNHHYVFELRKLFYDRQIIIAAAKVTVEQTTAMAEDLRQICFDRDSVKSPEIMDVRDSAMTIIDMTSPRTHGIYDVFGLEQSDEIQNAMMPGNLTTIASRPGVGKTVMSTQISLWFARKYKEPVLYFATEMLYEETLMRFLSPMTQIPGWKFRKRVFDKDGNDITKIREAAEELSGLNIFVHTKSSPTIEDIRAAVLSTKCKLLIVDYIQRLRMPKAKLRNEALEAIMITLKNMGKELGIMVVVLCQMDRETDYIKGRQRPQMADLKGSGAIEAESDVIWLLWRKNKKDPRDPKKKLVAERNGIRPVEAICAKNRHGISDVSVQLIFEEKFISFREATKEDRPGKQEVIDAEDDKKPEWIENL